MGITDEILPIIDTNMTNSERLKFRSENDLRGQKAKWFDFPQAGIIPLEERKSPFRWFISQTRRR